MKAVVFGRFGEPAEVLEVRDVPTPEPKKGEVRVKMTQAPINPSDLMTVRGIYGRLPPLPATPGFEGVGVVDAVGGGWIARLRGLKPGRRVAVIHREGGTWAEYAVVSARQAIPLPDDLPDDQAASFFVNPATVLAMTNHVLRVPAGGWLLQTAAGSALGRMVIRLGKHQGFRTINLVRRAEQKAELQALGADVVICTTTEDVVQRVHEATGGVGVPHAMDAVGGSGTVEVVRSLAPGGQVLVYGTLSAEPIPLEPRLLMGQQKSIEGFWLSEWVKTQGVLAMLRLFRQVTTLMRAGVLTTPVGAKHDFNDVRQAVRDYETPGRAGKILLRPGG